MGMICIASANKPNKDYKVHKVTFGLDRTNETKKSNCWTLAEGKRNSILAASIMTPSNSRHAVGQTVFSTAKGTLKW